MQLEDRSELGAEGGRVFIKKGRRLRERTEGVLRGEVINGRCWVGGGLGGGGGGDVGKEAKKTGMGGGGEERGRSLNGARRRREG